jgi:hypothetical protein
MAHDAGVGVGSRAGDVVMDGNLVLVLERWVMHVDNGGTEITRDGQYGDMG